MLKQLILTASILLSCAAIAEPVVVKDAKFPVELKDKCKESCLVMDKADWEQLNAKVQEYAAKAYAAGVAEGKAKERGTI